MKILIVDDEPLVRKSLGRAFRSRGHEVIEAVDGLEGFELWKSSTPDLIFVDVLMPGLSGPELLEKFSAEIRPRLGDKWKGRVILMSAYSGEHNIATAQQMGANLFVPKPFDDIFALVAKAEALFNESSG